MEQNVNVIEEEEMEVIEEMEANESNDSNKAAKVCIGAGLTVLGGIIIGKIVRKIVDKRKAKKEEWIKNHLNDDDDVEDCVIEEVVDEEK